MKIPSLKRNIAGIALIMMIILGSVFSAPRNSIAAFNKQFNYQGKLTNNLGATVADGSYNMELKLYTVSSGGSAIWTEDRIQSNRVTVTSGLFSIMLGDVTSLAGIDFNQTLYLGVNIGGTTNTPTPTWDGEMTPRKKLGAVPAAVTSENVGGFFPAQSATGSQIPALTSGVLSLGDTAPGVSATGSTALTFNGGVTGDIQFFSSLNKITSAGALTLAGALNSAGITSSGTITFSSTPATSGGTYDVLTRDTTTGNVEKVAASTFLTSSTGVTGSGTTNYVPKFASGNTLANSGIYDSGSNILIGSTSDDAINKLQVTGSIITNANLFTLKGTSAVSIQIADSVGTKGLIGVATASNNFVSGSAAGDLIFRTPAGKMIFDTNNGSGTSALKIGGANGSVTIGSLGTGIVHSSSVGLLTSSAVDVSSADITGILAAASFPALTGDITTSAGALATTLATVNGNVGSFGSSTSIPTFTVNGKGLITAASGNVVIAPAGTLTGTTLAAGVTTSSLTSFGANPSANNFVNGYTTTATAAGTTTLTVASTALQYFTGSTTQTVKLPVASTLVNGQRFIIANNSTGVVTVQTSGSNTLQAMVGSSYLIATVVDTTAGTGTASWSAEYIPSMLSTNTANTLVLRDGSGNFSAGTISAALSGNATTATALATGRTISITGDLAYTSPSFDGSGNVTAAGTLATVNSNVGTFNTLTVNGKGLVTAASNTSYEVPLTFSTGLTRTVNTITDNLATGISGGQSVIGGTGSGDNLTLSSTSNATKGKILFGTSAYDEVNNRLGIGTASPGYKLDVQDNINVNTVSAADKGYTAYNGATGIFGLTRQNDVTSASLQISAFGGMGFSVNQSGGDPAPNSSTSSMFLASSGNLGIGTTAPSGILSLAGARTAAAWGTAGINFQTAAATYTDSSTGASTTVTNNAANSFGIPTFAASNTGVVYTNPATLYIAGAPVAGTNVTETNPLALYVAGGNTSLSGSVGINTTSPARTLHVLNTADSSSFATTPKTYTGGALIEAGNGSHVVNEMASLGFKTGDDTWFINSYENANNNLDLAFGHQYSGEANFAEAMRILSNGNLGVGTTSANARIESSSTTEQLRLSYDPTHYSSFTTSSAGNLTIAPLGGATSMTGTLAVSSVSDATGNFLTLSGGGVLQKRTAAETLSDIGAAPSSGSTSYIQNGTSQQASSNFNISGNGTIGGNLYFNNATLARISSNSTGEISLNYNTTSTDRLAFYGGTTTSVFTVSNTGSGVLASDLTVPTVYGSASSGGNLTLASTSNATKGKILFGTSAYDEVNNRLGIGTASPGFPLDVTGSTGSRFTSTGANTAALSVNAAHPASSQYGLVADIGESGNGNLRVYTDNSGDKDFTTWTNWSTANTRWEAQATTTVGSTRQEFGIDGSIGFYTQPSTAVTAGNAITYNNTLFLKGNGNVGIGTTGPATVLHVNTASGDTIGTFSSTGSTSAYERFVRTGSNGWAIGRDNTNAAFRIAYSGSTDTPDFATAANNYFNIINSGNVGIGTNSPSGLLSLAGARTATAWGTAGINFQTAAATYTDSSSSGTVAGVVANSIGIPTFAASSATTYTDAANLYIAGAPAAGTNVTLTNPYALYIAGGTVRLNNLVFSVASSILNLTTNTGVAAGARLGSLVINSSYGVSAPTNGATILGDTILGGTTDNGYKLDVQGTTNLGNTTTLATAPTTSAGTYDILTRNTSTGVVEKVASSTFALDSSVVHIAGTETITGVKTLNPSVTAASGVARGTYFTPTLTAAANNDVLAGVEINPTFTNGSFTNVSDRFANFSVGGSLKGYIDWDSTNSIFAFKTPNGRMDFNAGSGDQFFTSANLYFNSRATLTRSGDAVSTATQKSSWPLVFQTSQWNGSTAQFAYAGIVNTASTATNLANRISFYTDATSTDLTTGTERMSILNSSGNVGIGTTNPGAKLDILATASATVPGLLVESSGTLANNIIARFQINSLTNGFSMIQDASSNVVYQFLNGSVGIGSTAPASLFSVGSSSQFQVNSSGAIAAATGITSSGTVTFSGLGGGGTQCVQTSNTGVLSAAACGGSVRLDQLAAATAGNTINNAANQQEWQWNTLAGGDGLKLSTSSTAAASNTQKLLELSLTGANATSSQTTYGEYINNAHSGTTGTNIGLYVTAASNGGASTNYAAIFDQGRVGIQTTTPQVQFEVSGVDDDTHGGIMLGANGDDSNFNLRIFGHDIGLSKVGYEFQTKSGVGGTNTPLAFDNAGLVGINTISPSSQLDVTNNALGTTQDVTKGIALVNTTAAAAGAQQISPEIRWSGKGWKTTSTAASQAVDFRAFVTPVQGTANPSGFLGFGSSINGGSYNDNQLVLTSDGKVGIGTTSPAQLLDVAGNINISSASAYMINGINIAINPGGFNYFFGNAGNATLSSANNTGVGNHSLIALTSGNQNTSVGSQSLSSNTTGSDNTGVGVATLALNITGSDNTAIGWSALGDTTGSDNTAVGSNSLTNNTTGSDNTAVGWDALENSTTSSSNTATGRSALIADTTGAENSAFGKSSLFSMTTGNQNTAVGRLALQSDTTGSGETAVGYQALDDLNITANNGSGNNTALGYNTGRGIVTGVNNTIIGANVTGLSSSLSNNIILADGAGNQRINIDNTGKVGIGNTSPGTQFVVGPSTGALQSAWSGVPLTANFSTSTVSNDSIVLIEGNGNGNNRAGVLALRDNRSTSFANNVASSVNDYLGGISFEGFSSTTGVSRGAAYITSQAESVQSTTLSGNIQLHVRNSSGTDLQALTVKSNGNVLIGTTTDDGSSKLQVNGTAKATVVDIGNASVDTTLTIGASNDGLRLNNSIFGEIAGFKNNGASYFNGKVGIATTSPSTAFQVGTGGGGTEMFNVDLANDVANMGDVSGFAQGTLFTVDASRNATFTFANGDVLLGNGGLIADDGVHMLQVNGTMLAGTSSISGIVAHFINSTGTCDINPTSSSLSCSSDIRLKKNITDINDSTPFVLRNGIAADGSSLDKVMQLTPVQYNWNPEADGTAKHAGFIAQEVEQVFPDLVSTDPKTGLKSLNYMGLIPYTIDAVQEMNVKIKGLSSLDTTDAGSLGSLMKSFLGDVHNTIADLYASTIHANRVETKTLCVGDTCVTEAQLKALLQQNNMAAAGGADSTPPQAPAPTPDPTPTPTPDPSVTPPADSGSNSGSTPPTDSGSSNSSTNSSTPTPPAPTSDSTSTPAPTTPIPLAPTPSVSTSDSSSSSTTTTP